MPLVFEYFYGNEAEQFAFYRIPKILFKDKAFKDISAEAKVLYGLMLDRMGLSVRNGWLDKENRVYVVYTIAEIMEDLNCADQKVGKLLSELDNVKGIGLIERKRQGLGKPNIIYVKNFCVTSRFKNSENHDSGKVKITNQEYPKSLTNNTDINNTEFNDTILSYHNNFNIENPPDTIGWEKERKIYERLIKHNIEYDILIERFEKSWLDEIIEIMVDVVCSSEPYIRINKQEYPQEIVKNRFLKINSLHIEYIYFALKDNSSNIRNIRAFLITTIYRSFETADNWFSAKVNYNMTNTKEN